MARLVSPRLFAVAILLTVLWSGVRIYAEEFGSFMLNPEKYEGKLFKGNRNAIFLIRKGKKHHFPDFNTFVKMGFDTSMVEKVPDDFLQSIPVGDMLKPIPVFRPDDYMYHALCDDPDRLVNELGVVANMGDFSRYISVLTRVKKQKKVDVLALGGSITAGGYFMEFVRSLREKEQFEVDYHNHGHGATELTYTIFCVDIEKYSPDLVLIDFSVNDYGHPKLMDALVRKVLVMPSKPIVVLVNLWVTAVCPPPRYLLHSFYYQIPLLQVCPAVNNCFGRAHLPKHIADEYSKTDGVHPWGPKGVKFLGDILYAWWKKFDKAVSYDVTLNLNGKYETHTHSYDEAMMLATAAKAHHGHGHQQHNSNKKKSHKSRHEKNATAISDDWSYLADALPPPLYVANPIGLCTRCEALAGDADAILTPSRPPQGFRQVTRTKIGFGGFNPSDRSTATKSFKRSWQADTPGAQISFKFYGSSVKIAIWQRRDAMGVLHAHVDGDSQRIAKASGFFKGYTWAMEKNNTGRSEIMPLFEGLSDTAHELTLTVSDEPANPWVKGHLVQVFALLSASDNLSCKNVTL